MLPKDEAVHISWQFKASAVAVFDAWINPLTLPVWFFAGADSEIVDVTIDSSVGGAFSIKEKRNSIMIDHSGKYVELEWPGHLAFSLETPQHFTGTSYVSIFIIPKQRGCELRLIQTGVSPEKTTANWYLMLERLEQILQDDSINPGIKDIRRNKRHTTIY